jgi:hypothetical protein
VDPNGEEIVVTVKKTTGKDEFGQSTFEEIDYHYGKDNKGDYGFMDAKGNKYSGTDAHLLAVADALNTLRSGGETGAGLIDYLINNNSVKISAGDVNGTNDAATEVQWNKDLITGGGVDTKGSTNRPTYIGLGHELGHIEGIWKSLITAKNSKGWQTYKNDKGEVEVIPNSELYATHVENKLRSENNLPLREYYASNPQQDGENAGTKLINSRTNASLYVNSDGKTNFKKLRRKNKPYIYTK